MDTAEAQQCLLTTFFVLPHTFNGSPSRLLCTFRYFILQIAFADRRKDWDWDLKGTDRYHCCRGIKNGYNANWLKTTNPAVVLLGMFTGTAVRRIGGKRLRIWQVMLAGAFAMLITGGIVAAEQCDHRATN